MNGSDPGFEEFYAAHATRLLKVAQAIVRDQHAAEDVVQTAFAKAYAVWWRVGRANDPVAYTRRIVVNAALAHLRTPVVRREAPLASLPEQRTEPTEAAATDEGIWSLLEELPPRRRAVVVLRYYEGLSEQEIADVMRCRPGTVKSQASAALKTLRERLTEMQEIAEGTERGHRS